VINQKKNIGGEQDQAIDLTANTAHSSSDWERLRLQDNAVASETAILGVLIPGPRLAGASRVESRRAISLCIDRNKLARDLKEVVNPSWRPSSIFDDTADAEIPEADWSSARRIWNQLEDSELDIMFASFSPNIEVVTALAEQISESIHQRIRLRQLDWEEYLVEISNRSFDLAYALMPAQFLHPSSILSAFRNDVFNISNSSDSIFGELCNAMDASGTMSDTRAAEDYWLEQLPLIPICRTRSLYIHSSRVSRPIPDRHGLVSYDTLKMNSMS
jgi:ABC-type oligopeptide transport system substrate-binding subunit